MLPVLLCPALPCHQQLPRKPAAALIPPGCQPRPVTRSSLRRRQPIRWCRHTAARQDQTHGQGSRSGFPHALHVNVGSSLAAYYEYFARSNAQHPLGLTLARLLPPHVSCCFSHVQSRKLVERVPGSLLARSLSSYPSPSIFAMAHAKKARQRISYGAMPSPSVIYPFTITVCAASAVSRMRRRISFPPLITSQGRCGFCRLCAPFYYYVTSKQMPNCPVLITAAR
jgi:hypothetical protein